jgi:hypothetical protein
VIFGIAGAALHLGDLPLEVLLQLPFHGASLMFSLRSG